MFQCTETGGTYIGSSVNIYDRFYEHLNGCKSNLHLQHAANKYSWDSFIFRVIESCSSSEQLVALEQSYLDILFNNFPKELIYNFCAVAYSMLGYIHTAETKAAISMALSGRTLSAGAPFNQTKASISAALSGNTNGVGNKNRSGKTGYNHTPEAKAAIGAANRNPVFVYDRDNKLVGKFLSQSEAAQLRWATL
jgi:group I intron endonuclease